MDQSFVVILVAALIIFFLVFREVLCWYWKINKNIELLLEIRDLLKHVATKNGTEKLPDWIVSKEEKRPTDLWEEKKFKQ